MLLFALFLLFFLLVLTPHVQGAGTTALVVVELIGVGGASSGLRRIGQGGRHLLQRGSEMRLPLRCADVGELVEMRVTMEPVKRSDLKNLYGKRDRWCVAAIYVQVKNVDLSGFLLWIP